MKPQKKDILFDEALEIIKRNAQKDPMNAYSWIDLLEGNLEKYADFDKWCLERYSVSANEYLLNNRIINKKIDISDDTNAINIESAILAYQKAIQTIYHKGERTYNDYIVGDAKVVGEAENGYQYNGESILTAHDFFTRLDNNEDQEAKEKFAKERNGFFKYLLDNKDFYWVMEGILEPEVSVAVAIAYVLFIDPKAAVYLEFLRNKWEYRGDYGTPHIGDKWLYFYYSSEAPIGEVGWKYWKSPLKYEWEIKKEEERRKTECQQMISLNTYDEEESLDINNKKILFLIDYETNRMYRFRSEYKYIAGSMKLLFNYSCSFVGSIEAKPDYIIIDQNSVTREDLQAAIIYKKINPDVIVLELNRFVALLENLDLSKLDERKPALTDSDMGLDKDLIVSSYKTQGKTLKEIFDNDSSTDLEIIKVAKHVSVPESFAIKDKVFVYTGYFHESEDMIKNAGGIIKKKVTGKTDYFVVDFGHPLSEAPCAQANKLIDKGKGDKLHIITPRILNEMLKG